MASAEITKIEFGTEDHGALLALVTFSVSDHQAQGVALEPFQVSIAVDAEQRDYAAIARRAQIAFRQLMSSLAGESIA